MAEEQKPVEVPKEETAPIVAPAEVKPVEETVAAVETKPTDEVKPAEEIKPAEGEAPKEEAKEEPKEEAKPVEEGHLSHKAQGLSFPKNLIATKEFFWFGADALEAKAFAAYQKAEKSVEVAQSNIAWATETGKGLLFVGDKQTPSRVINLSDATEPEVDGTNKFHFTAKGNKHSFKAASAAERDNWVAQLKAKIAEAKELAATVTETETYKKTIESFKPAPPVVPAKVEEAPKVEETPAEAEVVKEEPKKEAEEPKRRSASRKRASFFSFGAKKEESKKEEVKAEEAEAAPATEAAPVAETEAPKTEEVKPAETEVAPVVEAAPAVEEVKPAEEDKAAETVESPKEKPTVSKRNSIFGSVFSRKEKKVAEAKPAEAAEPAKTEEVTPAPVTDEVAPVIPPVETTTPLAVDVSSPATVPTEVVSPVVNGETPKEKRKSSLGFNFGRKSPGPVEGEEKSGLSAFSRLRATINRKSSKPEDKPAEAKEEDKPEEEAAKEDTEEAAKEEAPKTTEPEAENKPEAVAATTPAVTAAA